MTLTNTEEANALHDLIDALDTVDRDLIERIIMGLQNKSTTVENLSQELDIPMSELAVRLKKLEQDGLVSYELIGPSGMTRAYKFAHPPSVFFACQN
jgi:predicted ArsR family transcriptional regulator